MAIYNGMYLCAYLHMHDLLNFIATDLALVNKNVGL